MAQKDLLKEDYLGAMPTLPQEVKKKQPPSSYTVSNPKTQSGSNAPVLPGDQIFLIYDPDKNHTLIFDGVIRIQHAHSVEIKDSSDNNSATYTNSAKIQPNEITVDVAMSNVHTATGYLPGTSGDRIRNAFAVLTELKEGRRLLQCVTSLATYRNMLLKSIAITQDDTATEGWTGSLVFHEQRATKKKETSASSVEDAGARTASLFYQTWGEIIPGGS